MLGCYYLISGGGGVIMVTKEETIIYCIMLNILQGTFFPLELQLLLEYVSMYGY